MPTYLIPASFSSVVSFCEMTPFWWACFSSYETLVLISSLAWNLVVIGLQRHHYSRWHRWLRIHCHSDLTTWRARFLNPTHFRHTRRTLSTACASYFGELREVFSAFSALSALSVLSCRGFGVREVGTRRLDDEIGVVRLPGVIIERGLDLDMDLESKNRGA